MKILIYRLSKRTNKQRLLVRKGMGGSEYCVMKLSEQLKTDMI